MSELSVGSLSGLAANSFVIDVASGSTLDLSNATDLPVSALPAGSILQVVSVSVDDTFTTTSTSYVERTGLSASITPSSTSSKIYAQLVNGGTENNTGTQAASTIIYRNGADIGAPASTVYMASGGERAATVVNFLDSPNTTSAVTYAGYVLVSAGTGSYRRGTLTLMEVAG